MRTKRGCKSERYFLAIADSASGFNRSHKSKKRLSDDSLFLLCKGYEKDTKIKTDELGQKADEFFENGFKFNDRMIIPKL